MTIHHAIARRIIMGGTIAIAVAAAFGGAYIARAATVSIGASATAVSVGAPFRVDVVMDTQGSDTNAVQGEVTFPSNLFAFSGIVDGDSPVSLWIEAPHETASGTVSFSGIMPGGFDGKAPSLVGIVLTPLAQGSGTVAISGTQLLANDSKGTPLPVTERSLVFEIGPGSTSSGTGPEPGTAFTVPAPFTPQIAHDPNVYGGKYFLVFSTTDKGSGIDHYEVAEVAAGSAAPAQGAPAWVTASSPYLLKDQSLLSDIYVRAVNHAGSATIAKLPARNPGPHGLVSGVALASAAVLLLVLLGAALLLRRKRGKMKAR